MAAALLVLGIGLCLFDGDADHHNDPTAPDLCLGMIAVSLLAAVLAGPLASGWIWPDPGWIVSSVSPHLPDPPPKSALRF
jgi:hypothetical protein